MNSDKDLPENVGGLQEIVCALESAYKKLVFLCETICRLLGRGKSSTSFRVFYPEVNPMLYDKLIPLCIVLDHYLVKQPSGEYDLEFNLEKHPKKICYQQLHEIKRVCLFDAHDDWFYRFILEKCNLGDTVGKVKEGLRPARR